MNNEDGLAETVIRGTALKRNRSPGHSRSEESEAAELLGGHDEEHDIYSNADWDEYSAVARIFLRAHYVIKKWMSIGVRVHLTSSFH